ncbi:lipoyl(octanoyl) transferase LipB [Carboxylicivirga sp. M1479]|uniref:lipoyl(octanoyl) transferase LipB n=1 Tax=Carboxylicivirga sp. M1479 TaxID=2594476 RepID=UPI0011781A32|nr:lipoyl(octanoyl) transferase LipB [Carboxylicivirga sp. M1479]TRX71644.1 lipoyl(octanoyl) transferase LipB [Carboxylicivirga sp. M1479]
MDKGYTVFEDLAVKDYQEVWDYQEQLFAEVVDVKLHNRDNTSDLKPITNHLLFVEHPHVYTLGKSGVQNNLLINEQFLKQINATFYKINRGGDITYHGPGQLVGYPILDLEELGLTVKTYIHNLEEAIIQTLAEYGIKSERLDGATGVWLDTTVPGKSRKISAIGVKASRYVSMHGFALNINTDLSYFNHINPCGFVDKGVTSMEKELGRKIDMQEVKDLLLKKLVEIFNLQLNK